MKKKVIVILSEDRDENEWYTIIDPETGLCILSFYVPFFTSPIDEHWGIDPIGDFNERFNKNFTIEDWIKMCDGNILDTLLDFLDAELLGELHQV